MMIMKLRPLEFDVLVNVGLSIAYNSGEKC